MSLDQFHEVPSRLLPQTIEDVLKGWLWRAAGAALLLLTVGVWIALISWSANDPSLSLDTSAPAQNLLGPLGAIAADFFFNVLGLASIFFLTPPLIFALQLASGDERADYRRCMVLYAIATVALAGGCAALPVLEPGSFDPGYGGIVGHFAYNLLGGIADLVLPTGGRALTGAAFFAIGGWAFSHVIGLDQRHLSLADWQTLKRRGRSVVRRGRRTGSKGSKRSLWQWLIGAQNAKSDAPASKASGDLYPSRRDGMSSEPELPVPARNVPAAEIDPVWSPDDLLFEHAHPVDGTEFEPQEPNVAEEFATAVDDDFELPRVLKQHAEGLESAAGQPASGGVMLLPLNAAPRAVQRPPPAGLPVDGIGGADRQAGAPAAAMDGRQPPRRGPGYRRPSLNLLGVRRAGRPSADFNAGVLQGRARMLEDVLQDFRVKGQIRDVKPGPVITLFEFEPARGTKSSRVIALADDVARSMSALSARIAVLGGRNTIGIELPNAQRETFGLRELIDSQPFIDSAAKLPIVLGRGIGGEPVLADLARMPHLLVAGTTGSGKSVGINAMILSLIYRFGPEHCRLMMIDPKMLELSAYNGIPHLITPVITDAQKAVAALNWLVGEMDERYKRMAELGVRSIDAFNNRVRHAKRTGEAISRTVQTGFDQRTGEAIYEKVVLSAEPLPYIVVVVDEFADLMAVAGKEIEALVQRLAQMARAAGIHMIMATQRPSVDVVTGTIKANFPTRISYRVASRIDSRTILNEQGAEQLLGQGDMLFLDGAGNVQRVHGPFVSDEEVEAIAVALKSAHAPNYIDGVTDLGEASSVGAEPSNRQGDLFQTAVEVVTRDRKASTSYLQRRLGIGYNRAADLIDRMEAEAIIGPADHAGRREILRDV